ncbi:hypothetical protein L3Q82_012305 [Scortum barcoo]|uniref:Uncharacterized protein n=1 Tax=Scortum barcoo TaxID=214431 RepID=A0ACB8W2I6_9TELE|nr:hypothetical protein L3Q82_012305 [Scortum barcoo]
MEMLPRTHKHFSNHLSALFALIQAKPQLRKETHPQSRHCTWKIFTMRQSLMSVIFAAALLFECYALSVALPMGKTEDGSLEQDSFATLLSDEVAENSLADADLPTAGKTRGPRVIVVADPSLWRDLRALHDGLSLYKRRADDNSQVIEHRDAGQDLSIPILRRDTMRCMVGRVYRPCWEV